MNRFLATGKKCDYSPIYKEQVMTKSEIQNLIHLAIAKGDMEMAQMYTEQLKKELENDFIMRAAVVNDLDEYIKMGIWLGDY